MRNWKKLFLTAMTVTMAVGLMSGCSGDDLSGIPIATIAETEELMNAFTPLK